MRRTPSRRDHRDIGDAFDSRDTVQDLLAERRRARLQHLEGAGAPEEVASREAQPTGRDERSSPDKARRTGGWLGAGRGALTGADAQTAPGWCATPRRGLAHVLTAPRRPGRLRRGRGDRLVGGVAIGISHRTGIDPMVVRGAFVLSTVLGGFGIAAYVLAWLFVPLEGEDCCTAARAIADRRGLALVLAGVPLLALLLIVASALGATWMKTVAWPLFLAAGGLVLVWRNVSDAERSLLRQSFGPLVDSGAPGNRANRLLLGRAGAAILLALGGGVALTRGRTGHGVLAPFGGLLLVALGVVIAFGPWWVHIVRDLIEERQARARAEERADIAAKLHDSVLQTLALVQRQASDPHQVVTLARAQERELRAWLFEGRVPGSLDADTTVAAGIERMQFEVESLFGVPVEAVVVGDCPLDEDLRSLLEAAREATVNAAKWSGAPEVSVFAEVGVSEVAVYVRDRGKGFEESAVAADRRGVAESIRGRVSRHGGCAELRSTLGEGTEVTLKMPRR